MYFMKWVLGADMSEGRANKRFLSSFRSRIVVCSISKFKFLNELGTPSQKVTPRIYISVPISKIWDKFIVSLIFVRYEVEIQIFVPGGPVATLDIPIIKS